MTLDQYKAQYEEAMRNQGVTVTWAEDGGSPYGTDVGGYKNPDNWVATLSRDGVVSQSLVTLGRMTVTGMSPEQLAAQDVQYSLNRVAQLTSPQGQVATWAQPIDEDTRRFYEVYPHLKPGYAPPTVSTPGFQFYSTPGPGTTLKDPVTLQPEQTPSNPALGTVLTAPVSNGTGALRFSFWEWNYYYQEQTGRVGPSPEQVGVAQGTQMMTGAEWAAAVGNFYGGPVTAPTINGSGAVVGGTPTTPVITVGGSTNTSGGASTSTGGTPVGGTPTGPTTPPAGAVGALRSFWEWNALREQATGIPGDDPAHYGIEGTALLSLAAWQDLTAAYYAAFPPRGSGGAGGAAKDNTMLYMAAGLAAVLLLRKG